jgi:hypothetical protein
VPATFAQSTPGFQRIQFQPGATSAQVSGQVSGTSSAGYLLNAAAGQTMYLSINNGSLTVVSPSGQPLVRGTVTLDPIRSYSDVLRETGDYQVYVSVPAGTGATSFTLTVSIVGTPDRNNTAERIRFQPGTTGAYVNGVIGGGQFNSYVLYAAASQTMTLTLDNGSLTVVSPSGQPLVRGDVTADPIRYFNQVLPETGDYRVTVSAPAEAPVANYTLGISITGSLTGNDAPQRVRFAAGGTSAQVTGQLGPGQTDTYVLGAFAGQTMAASAPNTYVTIISPSGVVLAASQPNTATLVLPESGDYFVQFSTVGGAPALNYVATFSITGTPSRTTTTERIQFQTGATGAQVFGQVAGGQDNRYVLFAFAGQTMQISVDNGTLTVVSPSGQPLVRGTVTSNPVRNFAQVLPETGDYQVYVSAPVGSPLVNYTLTVTITR